MPRSPRPWFRFYSEATESLKVHDLPDRLVKPWLFMLCLANVNTPRGRLPSVQKVAFTLRVKETKAMAFIDELTALRFLDQEGSFYVLHEWDEWQKDSDANLTLGRATKNERTRIERDKNADTRRRGEVEVDKEEEGDKEGEGEGEGESRARDDDPPSYRLLRERWENEVGTLPFVAIPDFKDHAASVPKAWFDGAIDQTKLIDHPSWAYCDQILKNCRNEQRPPSSLRKAAAVPKSRRYEVTT